jgi:hypothetical protein
MRQMIPYRAALGFHPDGCFRFDNPRAAEPPALINKSIAFHAIEFPRLHVASGCA